MRINYYIYAEDEKGSELGKARFRMHWPGSCILILTEDMKYSF